MDTSISFGYMCCKCHDICAKPVNRLSVERRAQVINCLVEGNSFRSTKRLTNSHSDTVMCLMGEVGEGCAELMDRELLDLLCEPVKSMNSRPPSRRSSAW